MPVDSNINCPTCGKSFERTSGVRCHRSQPLSPCYNYQNMKIPTGTAASEQYDQNYLMPGDQIGTFGLQRSMCFQLKFQLKCNEHISVLITQFNLRMSRDPAFRQLASQNKLKYFQELTNSSNPIVQLPSWMTSMMTPLLKSEWPTCIIHLHRGANGRLLHGCIILGSVRHPSTIFFLFSW